jgi:SAM-dependent methyltransferase
LKGAAENYLEMRGFLKKSQFLVSLVNAFRQVPGDLRKLAWSAGRGGKIQAYQQSHPVRKLQVGCGYNLLEGWLNADYHPSVDAPNVIYLDATRPFPIASGSFDYVFTEHMIEHIWFAQSQAMLKECFRILKPGGRIRISTPNLVNIVSLLEQPLTPIKEQYIKLSTDKHIPFALGYHPGFVVNNFFHDFGHCFIFDAECLRLALEKVGFTEVRQWTPGKSEDAHLTGIESHHKIVGEAVNDFETLTMEARKP